MELMRLSSHLALILCFFKGTSTALPMTDYSQLNHDEPTHWTRAATTHAPSTSGGTWPSRSSRFGSSTETIVSPQLRIFSWKEDGATIPPPTVLANVPTYVPNHGEDSSSSSDDSGSINAKPSTTLATKEDNNVLVNNAPTNNDYYQRFQPTVYKSSKTNEINSKNTSPNSETITTKSEPGLIINDSPFNVSSDSFDDLEKSDHYYRYDSVDDVKKQDPNDNDIGDKMDISDADMDRMLTNFKKNEIKVNENDEYTTVIPMKLDYNAPPERFDSEQEEEEMRREDVGSKSVYDILAIPTLPDSDDSYDGDTPFKKWDRDSEEQEKILENIVFQANNETLDKIEVERSGSGSDEQTDNGKWFLLLLAGNSTIVRLRQKDFAKYLKLNLAARLSLDYDEVKLNKVVIAPPRLMVNVSVIPSALGNLDEEFDLNERLFGEEEAPLHKLAETNATLLELSGEEYHVVRFLSLRSQQPLSMDEVASETSIVISDKHDDIECLVFFTVGSACILLITPLIVALCKVYILPLKIKWPWKRDKPLFSGAPWSLPRHQRMEEPTAPIGGPLTVIYSGSFVERNGPPSGSWLEDDYQGSSVLAAHEEPNIENPGYGFGALDKSTISDICDATVLESPRFNIDSKLKILGCRPNHLLIPHTPVKRSVYKSNLDVRIPKGLDNPNYQT